MVAIASLFILERHAAQLGAATRLQVLFEAEPAAAHAQDKKALLGGHQRARLLAPLVAGDAAVEPEIGVELGGLVRRHRGELPVMEHAMLVELLDDLRPDAGKLGQVVRRAARRRQELELLGRRRLGLGSFR
jgi:hypothetical protein